MGDGQTGGKNYSASHTAEQRHDCMRNAHLMAQELRLQKKVNFERLGSTRTKLQKVLRPGSLDELSRFPPNLGVGGGEAEGQHRS